MTQSLMPRSQSTIHRRFLLKGGLLFTLFGLMVLAASCGVIPPSSAEQTAVEQQTMDAAILGLQVSLTAQAQLETSVAANIFATMTAQPTLTQTPTPTVLPAGATRISQKDGMVQIYIPAGEFIMGSNIDFSIEAPMHVVYLDAFWIDQTEVTNAQYALCVQEGACQYHVTQETDPRFNDPAYANHPVVYMFWQDAVDFCTWEGGRLPTEAEWEKADRGPAGRTFPWGEADPDETRANAGGVVNDTTPVGSYPAGASYYGLLDMAGNVREWISDWYAPDYFSVSPLQNPQGPESGENRVLKGNSFSDDLMVSRGSFRFSHVPGSPGSNRGFRCAASIP